MTRKIAFAGLRFRVSIAIAGAMLSSNAYCWGHLLSVSQGFAAATLTSASLKRHTINFCVWTDSKDAHLDPSSIDQQVRLVINMWLQPAIEIIGSDVVINRVMCDDKVLNLKITLGPDTHSERGASTYIRTDESRIYEDIVIRTNYRTVVSGHSYPIVDSAWIVKRFNPHTGKTYTLEEIIDYAKQHRLSAFDVGRLARVNELVSFNSSYNILLHEMGHAFGLCDMYGPARSETCDKDHASNPMVPFDSVMMEGGQMSLADDDRDGVKSLFVRYREMYRKRPTIPVSQ